MKPPHCWILELCVHVNMNQWREEFSTPLSGLICTVCPYSHSLCLSCFALYHMRVTSAGYLPGSCFMGLQLGLARDWRVGKWEKLGYCSSSFSGCGFNSFLASAANGQAQHDSSFDQSPYVSPDEGWQQFTAMAKFGLPHCSLLSFQPLQSISYIKFFLF